MYCVPIHDPQLASARRALAPFRILPKLVSYLTHRRSLRQSIKQMKRDARARYLEREKKSTTFPIYPIGENVRPQ